MDMGGSKRQLDDRCPVTRTGFGVLIVWTQSWTKQPF